MLIDCETCRAPATACRDCVMTVLLDRPPVPVELDDTERAALGSLADAGLVPPLRLVPSFSPASLATGGTASAPDATGETGSVSGSSGNRRDIA